MRVMKNKKGFTLIELLAVIVILGLLMAIAIPSVTKYITQSRKKTVTTTIGKYISALTNQVNDMEYVFTESNTVYAVPIECIALERGGTNPFGEWHQASNSYWAYVLVQYDDATSSYTYGFTFKDSAGYGLYPTTIEKLNESGKQIQQDLDLKKPKNGTVEKITSISNWTGFEVVASTKLIVLEAEVEGTQGDGVNTCTLCQKGKNYNQINYQESDKDKPNSELPILMIASSTSAFWKYKEQIKTITFEDIINIPSDAFKSWDVSSTGNGMVKAYIKENAEDSSYYDLYIQGDGRIYANPDSSGLFENFKKVDSINNIELLNISKVTRMSRMFHYTGSASNIFTLDLGDKFDTSNVTSMYSMFSNAGRTSTVFTLDLGDKFDTSNVTDMGSMFYSTGFSSSVFRLDLGDKFDTSNVTYMDGMFCYTGYKGSVFTLDLGDKFDTSNVEHMNAMFSNTGYSNKGFTLDLGDKFDTSRVIDMQIMFSSTGHSSTVFTLDLGDKFDTSNVTNMNSMFQGTGSSSNVFTLDLGDKFDTSNVTNMEGMFNFAGNKSTIFTLDLGDKFDTSNVTNMENMFLGTGRSSNVFTLNCSNWNVNKVTKHNEFNKYVESKVISPTWVK